MKLLCLAFLFSCCSMTCLAGAAPQHEALARSYAARYGISADLVCAFIDQESGWAPRALSSKGAMGLMQLMPATAQRFGAFDPYDPEQNIAAGTRYLTTLMWEFHGDERLVAAAFYAGEHRIEKRRLDYANPDVVAYVRSIRRHYLARTQSASARQED